MEKKENISIYNFQFQVVLKYGEKKHLNICIFKSRKSRKIQEIISIASLLKSKQYKSIHL